MTPQRANTVIPQSLIQKMSGRAFYGAIAPALPGGLTTQGLSTACVQPKLRLRPSTYRSMDATSAHRSIDRSMHRPIDTSIYRCIDRRIDPSFHPSIHRSIDAAFDRSIDPSFDPSIHRCIHRHIDPSMDQYIDPSIH